MMRVAQGAPAMRGDGEGASRAIEPSNDAERGATRAMTCANDDDPGVAGIEEWRS